MLSIDLDYAKLAGELAKHLEPQGTPWMTVTQAAEYLQASRRWVQARLNEIPHSKVDGKVLISRHDVDSWLANHRRRARCR